MKETNEAHTNVNIIINASKQGAATGSPPIGGDAFLRDTSQKQNAEIQREEKKEDNLELRESVTVCKYL